MFAGQRCIVVAAVPEARTLGSLSLFFVLSFRCRRDEWIVTRARRERVLSDVAGFAPHRYVGPHQLLAAAIRFGSHLQRLLALHFSCVLVRVASPTTRSPAIAV